MLDSSAAAMRVLTVTNMYPVPALPGYGIFVKVQVEALRALGVDTEVVFVDGRSSQLNYLKDIVRVRAEAHGGRWDLIHAHYGLTGWVARLQTRLPVVITFHGDDILGTPGGRFGRTAMSLGIAAASRVLQPFADATIVVSEEMRRRLWFGRHSGAVHVIPCGISLAQFRPIPREEAISKLELDPARRYVVFPSTPHEVRKRLDLAQAAMEIVRRRRMDAELMIVHKKPPELLPYYYAASDALLLTSDWEGSPMVVKEALACEVPVVAVPAGDVVERIGGLEGCYVCPREPEALARALLSSLERPRPGGLRDAVRSLDTIEVTKRIIQVYEHALARRS